LKFVDGIRTKITTREEGELHSIAWRSVVITQAEAPFGLDGDLKQDTNPLAFSLPALLQLRGFGTIG